MKFSLNKKCFVQFVVEYAWLLSVLLYFIEVLVLHVAFHFGQYNFLDLPVVGLPDNMAVVSLWCMVSAVTLLASQGLKEPFFWTNILAATFWALAFIAVNNFPVPASH